MLKKVLLAVLLVLVVVGPVLAQGPVYLPLIMKGNGGPMLPAELYITDGTTSINLIKPEGGLGYHLSDWRPAVADYKGGGTWQDSPLAHGRRLVDKRFTNVIETFRLTANEESPDALIEELQEMRRLLEKAADYWATDWQDELVWITARAHNESERRYALIHKGRIPEDDNPFAQPFMHHNGCAVMDNLTLVIERGPWLGYEPGTGTCVETSTLKSVAWVRGGVGGEGDVGGEWEINTNQPNSTVPDIIGLQSYPGRMLAADIGSRIWLTDTGAAIWTQATISPNHSTMTLLEASDGYIYEAGYGGVGGIGVWRSGDGGVNWVLRSNAVGTNYSHSLTEFTDSCLYLASGSAVGPPYHIWRSCDGGATWVSVYSSNAFIASVFAASDGYLYATRATGKILRSPNGTSWSIVHNCAQAANYLWVVELDDGYLYAGGTDLPPNNRALLCRSSDGINWFDTNGQPYHLGAGFVSDLMDLILASDGYYYAIRRTGHVSRSADLSGWEFLVDICAGIPNAGETLYQYSDNHRIYAGEFSDIWQSPILVHDDNGDGEGETIIGHSATCENEIYLANKTNVAQISHIWRYDASGPTWTALFPVGAFPFGLLPNPMAVGDIIYLGIDTSIIDSGPFDNLIFDIGRAASGDFTLIWEYSDGVAGWPTLNAHDNTVSFQQLGVNSIHWVPPETAVVGGLWTAEAVNGVTALWVRARVTAAVGNPVGPQQQNRQVYTVTWPNVDIDEAEVLGDITALARIKLENQSDEDGYTTLDELTLMDNRVIIGLRSYDRGPQYVAYLNCADEQNPAGITVSVTAPTTTFINEIQAPSGRAAEHLTQGLGLTRYTTEVTFTFDPSIARDYYGTYHAYVRAQLHESGVYSVGDQDDVRVRLQVQSGSGGVTRTTKYQEFTGVDAWGATEEEVYKDWQLLDFGQVQLPATGLLDSDELPDQMSIYIQVASAAGTLLLVDFYDLILIPVDEWSGDFVDHALETDSCIENGYMLHVDSITFPKRDIRALVQTYGSELLRSVYQPIVPGPAILQANADQKLWFLTARAVYMGVDTAGAAATTLTDASADFTKGGVKPGMTAYNLTTGNNARITAVGTTTVTTEAIVGSWNAADAYMIICPNWRSEPWVVHSIRVWNNPRYLSMRGSR